MLKKDTYIIKILRFDEERSQAKFDPLKLGVLTRTTSDTYRQ